MTSQYTIKLRSKILNYSLRLEETVNACLGLILKIENYQESKSLGSSGLSFSQKLNLLLDSKVIESSLRTDLTTFMEVRNKFVHDIKIRSLEQAVLENKKTNLKNKFPSYFNSETSLEQSLDKCLTQIYLRGMNKLRKETIRHLVKEGTINIQDDEE
ncbi:hypothetical protein ES692_05945 [Psychroserpens burtonensis]|uniref:DUF4145 domain-containing protein n=1 Tax=Psychroserpens burtonensis TaxID=49278 RepID=A0A5C7BBN0_9FLAO|nr:hypothetical protein [Psychroserpens burtonensis]TXE18583.1 hypothetical protein ES692_05945 [Psychroserpens burtonensis]